MKVSIINTDASEAAPVTNEPVLQKNQKIILGIGAVIIIGLLLIPDNYLKKMLPWIK